jgi:hypothetical protein
MNQLPPPVMDVTSTSSRHHTEHTREFREFQLREKQMTIAKVRMDKDQSFRMFTMEKSRWEHIDQYLCVLLGQEAALQDLVRRDRELTQHRQDRLAESDEGRTHG